MKWTGVSNEGSGREEVAPLESRGGGRSPPPYPLNTQVVDSDFEEKSCLGKSFMGGWKEHHGAASMTNKT